MRFSFSEIVRAVRRPATTRSSASSKSLWTICVRSARPARMAASLQMFSRSAPLRPEVARAMSCSETPASSGLSRVCTARIAMRPARSGGPT